MRDACSCALASVLLCFASGCGGGSSTPSTPISVSVLPATATVATGGTQQFSASVMGTTNAAVTWSLAGGTSNGAISATGLYTAPASVPNSAQVTITATSQADTTKSGSAMVTITGIGVQVLPASVTVQVNAGQSFSATVSGTTNTAVTWSVAGGNGNGTITASGWYTAPATVPNPSQVAVIATSQADTTKSGTATVTVTAPVPSIMVVPNPKAAVVFTAQQFIAEPSNLSSNAVTWQVNGVTGGSQQTGFISNGPTRASSLAGFYVAPGGVPTISNGKGQSTPTTVTVTAVSQVNPSVSGSAIVTINNSLAQNLTSYLGSSGGNQKDSETSGNSIFCCSGTLGSAVTRGGNLYILSNNHVLARDDLGMVTSGTTPGDNIIQPGLADTNCGQGIFGIIANLSQFYNLETGAAPKIDAAIAQPLQSGVVDSQGRILYLGATTDTNNVPVPGAPHGGSGLPITSTLLNRGVAKSGRTTGLTCSSISSISTTLTVQYPKGCNSTATFSETFVNQVTVAGGGFSAPGDSGSLIVTQDTADPVGLLFAGSDQDTAGNPVVDVLNYFQSGTNVMTFVGGATHQVIGCTLPTASASAVGAVSLSAVSSQTLQRAIALRAAHESELLARPAVQALGVGASQDSVGEAAIVFFVTKGAARTGIPQEVEGIRTRIIEGELFTPRGVLTVEQSEVLEQAVPATLSGDAIPEAEFARAKVVHQAHVDEWMSKAGVQGVGIGSSVDSPGESALIIFLIRGVAHEAVPPAIDGVRTRVRESSPFVAGIGDEHLGGGCPAHASRSKNHHIK